MTRKKLLVPILIILIGVLALIFIMINDTEKTAMSNTNEIDQSQTIPVLFTVTDQNGKDLDIAIKEIPQFKAYLQSQSDIKTELERTQAEELILSSQEHFVLLKYGCGNKHCSTILVKESDSKITSIALADGIFQEYGLSPDKNQVLLRYGYKEGGEIVRHILIAIDLLTMKVIPFESTALAKEYMFTPTWPIVDYQWNDKDRLLITAADLESSNFEVVKNWFGSEVKTTKKIEILLNKKDRLDSYISS